MGTSSSTELGLQGGVAEQEPDDAAHGSARHFADGHGGRRYRST